MAIPTHIAEKARHHHSVDVKKREAFIQRRFYTETLLHTDAFTHRHFYTQTLSHRDAFTRTETFTHRRFYTRTLLHTDPLIEGLRQGTFSFVVLLRSSVCLKDPH